MDFWIIGFKFRKRKGIVLKKYMKIQVFSIDLGAI